MTEEVPPSAALIRSLLELQPDAVLVGGQSLAAWAQHYALAPLPPLVPVFSKDIDFLARAAVADEVGTKLGGKVFHPSPDGHVQINTAVVSLPQGSDYVRVDFLAVVAGLDEKDIKKRALELEAFGTRFWVMHPVDCLTSRLENLRLLPEKRDEVGAAQAELAVKVMREFILEMASAGSARHVLDLAEFVAKLATKPAGIEARVHFGINVLSAIPVEKMPKEFRQKRWPQIKKYYEGKIQKAIKGSTPRKSAS